MALRTYQSEALESIKANVLQGINRQLVAAATGTGKTVLFANIPSYLRAGRWLVLVHRTELASQAKSKISHWNPSLKVRVEMVDSYADLNSDIIVASVQTLGTVNNKRLSRWNPDEFAGVIIDKCHHASADTYARPLKHFGLDQPGQTGRLLIGFMQIFERPSRSQFNEECSLKHSALSANHPQSGKCFSPLCL